MYQDDDERAQAMERVNDTPTWEYLTNRQIRMCFVPLNATPIYLDVILAC